MAWIATIERVELSGGLLLVSVRYDDGEHPFEETYRATDADESWLPQQVRTRIAQLARLDVLAKMLTSGQEIAPAPEPEPDGGENAALRDAVSALEQQKRLVELGVATSDTLAPLVAEAQTALAMKAAQLGR